MGDLRLPLGVCVKVEDKRGIVITWETGMDELQGKELIVCSSF